MEDDQIKSGDLIAWPPADFDMPLRAPVSLGGETYDSLSLREPTGDEWEKILAVPEAQRRRKAVSLVAGVPMGACALMGIGDLVRAEAYLNSFFETGQLIGV